MNPRTDNSVLFIVLFVIFVIVVAIVSSNQQKKRIADLQAFARSLGFTFLEHGIPIANLGGLFNLFGFSSNDDSSPYSSEFVSYFPLFNHGSSRRIGPAIVGSDSSGNNWFLFDYRYTISTGKSSSTYHFSVAIAQTPMGFPTMSLTPENVGYSVGKFFGMHELQVESEEFNQRYFIKTDNDKMSLDLLHPVAIEALLKQPNYEWHTAGPFVMIHLKRHISGAEYKWMMNCIEEFLAQVPAYYRQDHSQTHG